MWWLALPAGAGVLLLVVALFAIRYGVASLFVRAPAEKRGRIDWVDKGSTPLGEKKYAPQGMTWVEGKILFANTWQDRNSRVYEIDPATMEVGRTFDMPAEAVHTSGLAWDGNLLWGVDYRSHRVYAIRLEESLSSGEARLEGSFASTLRGTSACCILPFEEGSCLAISDFMHSRKTIFVRHHEALSAGTAAGHIVFSYANEGFSQGLEYAQGFLWESENKWGRNVINKMDMDRLRETGDARSATVTQYPAPSGGVEDLAWDGAHLWTSDETEYRFFRGTIEP